MTKDAIPEADEARPDDVGKLFWDSMTRYSSVLENSDKYSNGGRIFERSDSSIPFMNN